MVNFEDLDMEVELDSLDEYIGWNENNILDSNLPTPSPFDTLHVGLHVPNLPTQQDLQSCIFEILQTQNNEDLVTELAAAAPMAAVQDNLMGSIVDTENQGQTTEPIYDHAAFSTHENATAAPALVLDGFNPLPQSLPVSSAPPIYETQSGHPSSSSALLMLEGAVPSFQEQNTYTQMDSFNQFSHVQNENLYPLQGMGMLEEHNISNPLLVPNINENNNFSGIDHQSSSYPAFFHPNPVEAMPGIGTGYSSGQFITNNRPELFALQNPIISPLAAWNSRPEHNQLSAVSFYDSQYAPNYTQPLQLFTTMLPQASHASEMQKIFDLQSQNSTCPVYPMHPSSRYTSLYDVQNNHNFSQVMMPNGHELQGAASMQPSWSKHAPDQINGYNQRMNNNFQGLGDAFWAFQGLNSRILGLSGPRTNDRTSSQVFNSHETEIASVLREVNQKRQWHERASSENQLHQLVPVSTKGITTLPESSSTRGQPSEAIRRILNMNSNRRVTSHQNRRVKSSQTLTADLEKQLGNRKPYTAPGLLLAMGNYKPLPRGRPPKRRDAGDPSSIRGKLQKVSSGGRKARTIPKSQEAHETPANNVKNENQNANSTNPSSAPRQFINRVYDPKFERNGVHLDPHLRLFKAPPEN